jgi:aryl-alcohol dehydrogenase-like predicted oxidoreductase
MWRKLVQVRYFDRLQYVAYAGGFFKPLDLHMVENPDEPPQFALRWVIDQPGVSTVIPGARNPEQARANAAAAEMPPLRDEQLAGVRDIYDRLLRAHVHDRW